MSKYRLTCERINNEWVFTNTDSLARLSNDKKKFRTYEVETFNEKVSEDLREYYWSTVNYTIWYILHTANPELDEYGCYEMLLAECGERQLQYAPNGNVVGANVKRLSDMDDAEGTVFVNKCKDWCSQKLGWVIPESTRDRAAQKEYLGALKEAFEVTA